MCCLEVNEQRLLCKQFLITDDSNRLDYISLECFCFTCPVATESELTIDVSYEQ